MASSSSSSSNWSTLKTIRPDEIQNFSYEAVDPIALEQSREIVQDVRLNGDDGLLKHAVRLRDLGSSQDKYIMTKEDMLEAFLSLTDLERELLHQTGDDIRKFAQAQLETIQPMETTIRGGVAGQDVSPMAIAGCYAPGGRYPLPSSVLMTAITARVAGVKKIVIASPRPGPFTLAAAHVADADIFLAIGGAQSIAAMAYGTSSVPPCDIIVGPGNKWVTAAKSLIAGRCAIDMLAGPSECLVVADESANPVIIAADLLAQAEHDIAAVPILVTTSEMIIEKTNIELHHQLETLPTSETANISIQNGFAVLCPDLNSCISVTNSLAPEHLEVLVENAKDVSVRFENYGGMFIGERAAEVFGDYGAGPNHVLPTGGTAKYTGGLSVHTFLRIRTWMYIDDAEKSRVQIQNAARLARIEGLEGHARAAEARLGL